MKTLRLTTFFLILLACAACNNPADMEKPDQVKTSEPENEVIAPQPSDQNENPVQNNQDQESSDYQFLSAGAPAELSAEEKQTVALTNGFAFDLASLIDDNKGTNSYVFSPACLVNLLGMLSEGAAGETREEICKALGYDADGQDALNEFCRNLLVLASRSSSGKEVLEVANAIVVDNSFSLLEDYRKAVRNYYDASSVNMDFQNDNVVGYVNDWAGIKTHQKIPKVLDRIPDDCCAIFLSALYFSASWASPFETQFTHDAVFHGSEGDRNEKVMWKRDPYTYYGYCKADGFSMLKMSYGKDYEKSNYSMYIILPDEGVKVADLLSSFDGAVWGSTVSKLQSRLVDVKVPRFEIELDENLTDYLQQLGIQHAFSQADFSGMTSGQVFIDLIKQVANITVDESGTEAAAVTVGVMDGAGPEEPEYIEFTADRPFIFAIAEEQTGAILFMGSYK